MQAGGRDILSGAYCGVVRRASSCLGIDSGVGDFRWEAGAWNMVVGIISNVQLAGFVTFVED
jgi:hypothetical protein